MTNSTCSVGGCPKPGRSRGMCASHYVRWKKYGNPEHVHSLKCAHCESSFEAWSAAARYCSPACGKDARLLRRGFVCSGCSKPMAFNTKTSASPEAARCRECRNGGRGYYIREDGKLSSHGLPGYQAGCRCGVCRDASSSRAAKWNAEYTAKHGHHYSSGWRRRFAKENGFWPKHGSKDFVTVEVRAILYERDEWTCQLCMGHIEKDAEEFAKRASLDHVVPQSRGGSHDPGNLRMAHVGCNAKRRDNVDDIKEVSHGRQEAATPGESGGRRRAARHPQSFGEPEGDAQGVEGSYPRREYAGA